MFFKKPPRKSKVQLITMERNPVLWVTIITLRREVWLQDHPRLHVTLVLVLIGDPYLYCQSLCDRYHHNHPLCLHDLPSPPGWANICVNVCPPTNVRSPSPLGGENPCLWAINPGLISPTWLLVCGFTHDLRFVGGWRWARRRSLVELAIKD